MKSNLNILIVKRLTLNWRYILVVGKNINTCDGSFVGFEVKQIKFMVTIINHGKLQGITDSQSPSIIIIIINKRKLGQGDYFNQYSLKVLLTYK